MNLNLVLTYHWYDEVLSGRKRIEYREITHYWCKRIWLKRDTFKTVTFARGYTNEVIRYNVTEIDMGVCPYPEWPEQYYRIHFNIRNS